MTVYTVCERKLIGVILSEFLKQPAPLLLKLMAVNSKWLHAIANEDFFESYLKAHSFDKKIVNCVFIQVFDRYVSSDWRDVVNAFVIIAYFQRHKFHPSIQPYAANIYWLTRHRLYSLSSWVLSREQRRCQHSIDAALNFALGDFNIRFVSLLLQSGANPNAVITDLLDVTTPLLTGIRNCSMEVIEMLLEFGADPGFVVNHFTDSGGRRIDTPLCAAAQRGWVKLVEKFLKLGVNPNVKIGDYALSPANSALDSKHPIAVIECLLRFGADINAGGAPLIFKAVERRQYYLVEKLLSLGADPNLAGWGGYTPLHYAAMRGYFHIFNKLLESGADVSLKDQDGMTPLELVEHKKKISANSGGEEHSHEIMREEDDRTALTFWLRPYYKQDVPDKELFVASPR